MKIGFFKIFGMIGMLAEELTKAAEDGKITADEALRIVEKICEEIGISLEYKLPKIGG